MKDNLDRKIMIKSMDIMYNYLTRGCCYDKELKDQKVCNKARN